MLDFFTQSDSPVQIRINGTPYNLPRFLNDRMIEWSAAIRRQIIDEATAHLDDDDKARFLTFFQPPPVDALDMAQRALSNDGAKYVCDVCLKAAGVADAEREGILRLSEPVALRNLSAELTKAPQAKALLDASSKQGDGPLPNPPRGSDDSAAAPTATKDSSAKPIPASIHAA